MNVGAAAGGEAGAATAIDNVNFNYLTHEQAEKYRQRRAELDNAYAACKARLGNGCSGLDLTGIERQMALLNAEVQAQNTQNNVDLVKACSASMASPACVNGREELQKALDQDAGLQQSVLGGGHTNPQDAILAAVLTRVEQGEVTADKLGSAYQQALVKDQKITVGVALTALAVAGATVAPEVYSYCMFGNPNACVAVVEAAGCAASGTCDNLAGAVGSMGEATAAKATGQLEKLAGQEVRGAASSAAESAAVRFTYNAVENPGPLANLPGNPAANFISGKYNSTVLTDDLVLYRAGDAGTPLGQWFTREPPSSVAQVRIDLAVKPQWIDPKTGVLTGTSDLNTVYAVKIPKGTTIYEGPVGNQGGVYLGGPNTRQVFVQTPWRVEGVQVIGSTPIK